MPKRVVYTSDIESPTLKRRKRIVYSSDIDDDDKKPFDDDKENKEHRRFKLFQDAMKSDSVQIFASTFPRGYYRRDSVEYGPESWIQLFKVDKNQTIEQAAQAWVLTSCN